MTYKELFDHGCEILKASEVLILDDVDVQSDAWWLFEAACQMDRPSFFVRKEQSVDEDKAQKYLEMIQRRTEGEPVAYILGEWEFMGLPIKVTPAVLIPRQDTETLVEAAMEKAGRMIREQEMKEFRILDMCTGSGCIVISLVYYLKKQFPGVSIKADAVDISMEALEVARQNAHLNQVDVEFIQGDMFTYLDPAKRQYDMIVSNPPYIDEWEMRMLPYDVGYYEPENALFGGPNGLWFYEKLAEESSKYVTAGGSQFWEIGEDQAKKVRKLIEKNQDLKYIQCLKDYGGNDRVVEVERR